MSRKDEDGINDDDKMKIVFAPGCFDDFDGSQEELDELIAEIQGIVDNDTFIENSEPIDMDEMIEADPMLAIKLMIEMSSPEEVMAGFENDDNISQTDIDMLASIIDSMGSRKKLN